MKTPLARHLAATAVLFLLSLWPAAARADGLIFQLPPDGASATFDVKLILEDNGEEKESAAGTFKVSSVGQVENDGQKLRWIEIKMITKRGEREESTVCKLLIPEKDLQAGGKPFDNATKIWLRRRDREPEEIKDRASSRSGPLPAFLNGPAKEQKDLVAKDLETSLGKLSCTGVSGSYKIEQDGNSIAVDFETWRNKQAPFGVVATDIKFRRGDPDNIRESGTIRLVLSGTGKDARSELPDSQ